MSSSLESLVHETYVTHFGAVTKAFQELDSVIQDEYPHVAERATDVAIDHGVSYFYSTGDGYIDPQTLYSVTVHSARPDRTGLIEGMPKPDLDPSSMPPIIERAYEALLKIATSDGHAVEGLKKILDRSCPNEVSNGPIAVRRPLHVFRLAQHDELTDPRAHYAGDTVVLPEIVNAPITQSIGRQVVTAQFNLSALAGHAKVAKAITPFRSLHHRLSRAQDSRDPFWAPLRTYKEGVVTAAQAVAFLSQGITDREEFTVALEAWKRDKTFETIASCISGTVLGPLATHGAQPKGNLVRTTDGTMRHDFKAAMQAQSRERKQLALARNVNGLMHHGVDSAVFSALSPIQRAQLLIERQSPFLPGWGCLAPASVIRHSADLALAQIT